MLATPALLLALALLAPAGEEVTTSTGVKYEILKEGTGGDPPKIGDRIEIAYKGTLPDGKAFAGAEATKPGRFRLGRVIPAWNEVIPLMRPGAVFRIVAPPDAAYGPRGAQGVPADTTVEFEIELLKVIPARRAAEFRPADPKQEVRLASGLVYEVLAEGEGKHPAPEDVVDVHFTMWNEQGVFLDSSVLHGPPARRAARNFPVPFFAEILPLMKVGGSVRVTVPAALGYGDKRRRFLPPGSTTVWQVDLLGMVGPLPLPEFVMPAQEDLTVTESGLGYQTVKEGFGARLGAGESALVHFACWLADGTMVESSYEDGLMTVLKLENLPAGWREGMELMPSGATYRFVVPPALAYGDKGKLVPAKGPGQKAKRIPPGATLVYHVEFKEVVDD